MQMMLNCFTYEPFYFHRHFLKTNFSTRNKIKSIVNFYANLTTMNEVKINN